MMSLTWYTFVTFSLVTVLSENVVTSSVAHNSSTIPSPRVTERIPRKIVPLATSPATFSRELRPGGIPGDGPNVPVPFYRYFDRSTGDHFYTTDTTDIDNGKQSYYFQKVVGKIYKATKSGTVPLFRYYNTDTLHHYYTTNLGQFGGGGDSHDFHGICGYVFEKAEDDTLPLYRLHNGANGDNFYTTNVTELTIPGYKLETIEAYIFPVNYVEFSAELERLVATEILDTQLAALETTLTAELYKMVGHTVDTFRVNVTQLQEAITYLEHNTVPIGFIYVQLPHQSPPHQIWPTSFVWSEVSSSYAGQFFRVVGGDAAPFGTIQKDNAPRIIKAETRDSIHTFPGTIDFPVGGTSEFLYSAQFGTINKFEGTRYTTSGGEVRPINQAVKIWKRTG